MGDSAMNRIAARRFWLTWRSDIGSAAGLLLFMVAAFVAANLLARVWP